MIEPIAVSPPSAPDAVLTVSDWRCRGFGPDGFALERGKVTALVGGVGAGKSALLESLGGVRTAEGALTLNGEPLTGGPRERLRARLILAPSQPPTGAGLTFEEHVSMTAASGLFADPRALWPGPTEPPAPRTIVDTMSARTRRMVDMTRVLAAQPVVALLDGPAVDLGPRGMAAVIDKLREARATVLIADRYAPVVLALADRALFVAGGRIRREGDPRAFLDDRDIMRACMGEALA